MFNFFVQFTERNRNNQSDKERNQYINAKRPQVLPVIIPVHAAHALTQCIHAISKWQEFVYHLIYCWQDFDRECSTGTCNLNDHNDNCDCLSDISHRNSQGINKKRKYKAACRCCQPEQKWMRTLDINIEQIPQYGNRCLNLSDQKKCNISSKECMQGTNLFLNRPPS